MADIEDLRPYDGPLGPGEARLADRRIAVVMDPNGRVSLVRPNSVIIEFDGEEYERVARVLARPELDVLGGAPAEAPPTGVVGARDRSIERSHTARRVDDARRLADALRRRKLRVRPNHVFLADGVGARFGVVGTDGSSGTPGFAPPLEVDSTARPALPPRHVASPLRLPGHRPPHVLVLDTGLRTRQGRPEHPALQNCLVHDGWLDRSTTGRFDDEDEADDDHRGQLDTQGGHGTFISGIIRQGCPDAVVHHSGVLTSYGDGDHASLAHAVERALARSGDGYDVVVMALGTYAVGDDVAAMHQVIDRLLATSVVVASAGNDSTSRPYYPAALPGVIAVGALGEDGRAAFSNFGSWVAACAPGIDVVSTFFCDFDDRRPDRSGVDRYRGWARWSGTSFAAPQVAAAIAQEQYLHGGSANESWTRLTTRPRFRLPELGQVFNA
ncbi:MAG: S8 family peptidase [Ilumatobacteraceae bacterium]